MDATTRKRFVHVLLKPDSDDKGEISVILATARIRCEFAVTHFKENLKGLRREGLDKK